MLRSKLSFICFIVPGLIGLLVFYLLPFLMGIYYSLVSDSFQRSFVWLNNYKAVLLNSMFRLALKNTLLFSFVCAPTIVAVSTLLAAVYQQLTKLTSPRFLILLPYVIPSASIVLIWQFIFGNSGAINAGVYLLYNHSVNWLASGWLRIPVILMYLWRNLGFFALIIYSALQALPQEYYQYAHLEGASFLKQQGLITMPLIMPTLLFTFLLAWTSALKIFKEIYALSGGYPDQSVYSLQHYINNHFMHYNYSAITSASYVFVAIVFLFFYFLFKLETRYRSKI